MTGQGIAPHEAFELHEILTFKNVCLTKAVTMSALVSDSNLKNILQQDITQTQSEIKELRDLISRSNMALSTQ
ncbi:spore coat protein CotF [Clostridium polyendosporum]|uniref:Spore coat protein CotF n=1 Tax=Clostridium polyendosporum TaxID=69208 RepID=A0A919RWQ3_9CLOT|nr:spore coat protein [Clostridium polyendosporum]GIM27771.1 spore coat protein CotF [Clostridium polyendosporum]